MHHSFIHSYWFLSLSLWIKSHRFWRVHLRLTVWQTQHCHCQCQCHYLSCDQHLFSKLRGKSFPTAQFWRDTSSSLWRGVTRHLCHETRRDTRLGSRERDETRDWVHENETRHETGFTRTRRDTRLGSRERDETRFFDFFFKSSMIKYIGENSLSFNWRTQNAKK